MPPSDDNSRIGDETSSSTNRPVHVNTASYLAVHPHAPLNPSTLREAHTLSRSPDDRNRMDEAGRSIGTDTEQENLSSSPAKQTKARRNWFGRQLSNATESTSLLGGRRLEIAEGNAHDGPCNHGTFSPGLDTDGAASILSGETNASGGGGFFRGRGSNRRSTTARLAEEHGLKVDPAMYITYYVPFFAWIKQYKWSYLHGDLIAAITVASFYIPMALSLATNLSHIPAINGLYSFVFNPLIYAFLGSCPQMIVGPEAAGSLLVGSVVRSSLKSGKIGDNDGAAQAQLAGLVTGIAGAVILIAGITRLGFLENVLSRPFMRGFISSVGFIILIDQLVVEIGLGAIAESAGITHGSSIEKIGFLFTHWNEAHKLTSAVAFGSFLIIMTCREIKKRLQPRYPSVAYIPDRFLVVVFSAFFCYHFAWDQRGLEILGEVKSAKGAGPFQFEWPFQMKFIKQIREAMGTSFVIALLGFFESSVAAKNLGGGGSDGIQGISLSANRELVALGVANVVAGCFNALPGFGGYGRSKVNKQTGGKTPMASIFLSIITVICILFLLPYFYYLPVGQIYTQFRPPQLTGSTESSTLRHDHRRRVLPNRRSAPRHFLLYPHPRCP